MKESASTGLTTELQHVVLIGSLVSRIDQLLPHL